MTDLKDRKCEACRVGAPLVTQEEMDELILHGTTSGFLKLKLMMVIG